MLFEKNLLYASRKSVVGVEVRSCYNELNFIDEGEDERNLLVLNFIIQGLT